MKISIKQTEYSPLPPLHCYYLSEDEFIGFMLSKNGKKVLKTVLPNSTPNHPSILGSIKTLYLICSLRSLQNHSQFYIYDIDLKAKSIPTVFLQKYFLNQFQT
jgi:hypothetical protein